MIHIVSKFKMAYSQGENIRSDADLYNVVMTMFKFSLVTWGSLAVLGIAFHNIAGCAVFFLVYWPLRIFAGGLHFKTHKRCYFVSVIIFLVMMLAYKNRELFMWKYYSSSFVISAFIIVMLSPVQDINKPLTDGEQKEYACISNRLLAIALLVYYFISNISCIQNSEFTFFYQYAIKLLALQLMLGKLKNYAVQMYAIEWQKRMGIKR